MTFSIVLFDLEQERKPLLPLSATRPLANLRVGILTIDHKWECLLNTSVSYNTVPYLQSKFPEKNTPGPILYINGAVLPNSSLVEEVRKLQPGQQLLSRCKRLLAFVADTSVANIHIDSYAASLNEKVYNGEVDILRHPEDIFLCNARQIEFDLYHVYNESPLFTLNKQNNIQGDHLYIANTASVTGASLDARLGPIYIGEDAIIEPGTIIIGPVAIGKGVRVKGGTLLYPNVSIGPNCTIAGELNNTVIWGNSAKGHEGYLGCAVVGEGCNLGAGTTNSNLKNDWSTVKLYDYTQQNYRDTGLSKCGVIIGDQAMLAIHSKINTGTVIGVGSQVAMSNFIPKFVPDYSWLTDDKKESYIYERFVQMMKRKAALKREEFTPIDEAILRVVYEQTQYIRNY